LREEDRPDGRRPPAPARARDRAAPWLALLAAGATLLLLAGCGLGGAMAGRASGAARYQEPARGPGDVPGGRPEQGRLAMRQQYGCGACHVIPGVEGATGLVGPPLTHWSGRVYIAGNLANTPDNLVRWIRDPQGVEPGTAMPNLGVTEADARDIAAYLYTLR
jgi:cytochrome c